MEYEAFKETIMDFLREKTGGEKSISLHRVEKNNGIELDALVVRGKRDKIAPMIYLKPFYVDFQGGLSMEEIAVQILQLSVTEKQEEFSLTEFEDYRKARTKVYYKLVNYDMNKRKLQYMPHIKYLDLAVVFYYRLEGGKLNGASIIIHDCNLHAWGIEKEQLVKDALLNTSRKLPYTIQGMEALIAELSGSQPRITGEELMYILTNEEKYYGAAVILYPHVLNHIAKVLKKNFYILPSSVHECILVPDQGQYSRIELKRMVKEVNDSQVEDEEILSYEIYYYDCKKEALMM